MLFLTRQARETKENPEGGREGGSAAAGHNKRDYGPFINDVRKVFFDPLPISTKFIQCLFAYLENISLPIL